MAAAVLADGADPLDVAENFGVRLEAVVSIAETAARRERSRGDTAADADRTRRVRGAEHEALLARWLRQKGIGFLSEDSLRRDFAQQPTKTPDFLLSRPCGLQLVAPPHPSCSSSALSTAPSPGVVVCCWIESKALFADAETHREYVDGQLRAYRSRYGPGAVVYWFGCTSEVAALQNVPAEVCVLTGLPHGISPLPMTAAFIASTPPP